jgi:hypothetical protein
MKIHEVPEAIIGAAIEVHRTLGPGLLESAYEECLCRELALRGIPFERQRELPVDTILPIQSSTSDLYVAGRTESRAADQLQRPRIKAWNPEASSWPGGISAIAEMMGSQRFQKNFPQRSLRLCGE